MLTDIGPARAELGRNWYMRGNMYANSAHIRPRLVNFGSELASFGELWPISSNFGHTSCDVPRHVLPISLPKLVKLVPHVLRQTGAKRLWPPDRLAQVGAKTVKTFGRARPSLAEHRQIGRGDVSGARAARRRQLGGTRFAGFEDLTPSQASSDRNRRFLQFAQSTYGSECKHAPGSGVWYARGAGSGEVLTTAGHGGDNTHSQGR